MKKSNNTPETNTPQTIATVSHRAPHALRFTLYASRFTFHAARCTLLLLLSLFLISCGRSGSWPRIQNSGVLRVGLDPTYPPFETDEGGELRGLDVDLARAVAGDLGLQAEFVYFGYDGLYDALDTGQVDVLISALVIIPERTRDFAYSSSYFDAGEVLVVPAGSTEIQAMSDLDGRLLAVELGARGHVEATIWARQLTALRIQPFNTPDEALAAVTAGAAEAALVDHVSGRLYRRQEPGLQIIQPAVTQEPFAMVVRIEDRILLAQLDASLERLRASGQLQTITSRWLDQP